jgi:hypothetical protein
MCIYGSLLPLSLVSRDVCTYRLLQLQADGDTGCSQTGATTEAAKALYLGLFSLYTGSLMTTELKEDFLYRSLLPL